MRSVNVELILLRKTEISLAEGGGLGRQPGPLSFPETKVLTSSSETWPASGTNK